MSPFSLDANFFLLLLFVWFFVSHKVVYFSMLESLKGRSLMFPGGFIREPSVNIVITPYKFTPDLPFDQW